MNVLQITHQLPFPPDSGGRSGIFNITKGLVSAGHRVRLVSLGRCGDLHLRGELEKLCDTWVIPIENRNSLVGMAANLMLSSYPYNLSKYYRKSFLRLLDDAISVERPDIVHVDHLHAAYAGLYLKRKHGLPVVLREHNVEYIIMERLASVLKNPAARLYASIQAARIRRFEASVCSAFDICLPVSLVDERRLKEISPRCRTFVIPVGVDTTYFFPLNDVQEEPLLAHVGTMTWLPNVDGVLWFCNEVLPLIRRDEPNVQLCLVGANPPNAITRLSGRNGIVVTGYIKDPREVMGRASVYVVPLRIGGGVRMKILDAMAMGKAVVSTSVGCEGIRVEPGRDILVADSARAFAEAVVALLRAPQLRKTIGENALRVARSVYRWETAIKALEVAYKEAISISRQSGNAHSGEVGLHS